MKKFLLFAVACVTLAACDKAEPTKKGDHFEEGQIVTISAKATQAGTKISSKDNGNGIDFLWEEGDKILVKVGGKSSEFTLSEGKGTTEAQFTGTMPAAGDKFDVQYPVDAPSSIATSQDYSTTEAFTKGLMKFEATNCIIVEGVANFQLAASYTVLRLKFYGKNLTINKIEVTANSTTYTLNIATPFKLNDTQENANIFNIVMPTGSYTFKAQAYVDYDESKIKSFSGLGNGVPFTETIFETSQANSFEPGKVLNMDPRELKTVIFAPENLGYDATKYKWGKLYQWGRYVGGGYVNGTDANNDADIIQSSTNATWSATVKSNPTDSKFYYTNSKNNKFLDWYTKTEDRLLPAWPMKSGDTGYSSAKVVNPCPADWKVPSSDDYSLLIRVTNHDFSNTKNGLRGCEYSMLGKTGNKIFLAATGWRTVGGDFVDGDNVATRNNRGYYWACDHPTTGTTSNANSLDVIFNGNNGSTQLGDHSRANGCSVRCVQAE